MRKTLKTLALSAGLTFGLTTATFAQEAKIPDATYDPIHMEAGTWDTDITFYQDDKPAATAKGVQVNELLVNGHWITNKFTVAGSDKFPPYEGHGVWGYDPVLKTYVDTWVDTNDGTVRTDYGFWNKDKNVMTWSTKQSDGRGHFIDYRMVEEFKGDKRTLTFYQLGIAIPNAHILACFEFTKRPEAPAKK